MGFGMALVYPNLITAVGDTADPAWRGGALGIYRLWRDAGYAVGPLVLGAIATVDGIRAAIWTGDALLGASGLLLLAVLHETHPNLRRDEPSWHENPNWLH
jgi:MFS family permease